MATTPTFNPNNSREPAKADEAAYSKMTYKQKLNYLNKMWRNPLVSDTYVPGSTFKLLTTSMALEEDKTKLSEMFYDSGSINIDGTVLKCWRWYNPHGSENLMKMELLLPVAGLVYVLEALSVCMQVGYFKATKGKRLFKMSPLHHHFELSGMPETSVVIMFWIFTLACCIVALLIA